MPEKPKKTSINVPPELWDRAKHRAIDEKVSMGELVVRAIEFYLRSRPRKKEVR
jgi:hypothetical protein